MRTKASRQKVVKNAVELRIRMDMEKLKKDLITPYPTPKFANDVFIRALGAITLLEKDIKELTTMPNEVSVGPGEAVCLRCGRVIANG